MLQRNMKLPWIANYGSTSKRRKPMTIADEHLETDLLRPARNQWRRLLSLTGCRIPFHNPTDDHRHLLHEPEPAAHPHSTTAQNLS
jgi:hypothetical protein